ncbi:hypothetical protein AURDEDRAFT_32244, partial [Auricularia subglabra TFB-10046 SS5]
TGNWWWELQERLPAGVLIIPVIIASDKTQLTAFSGNKSAYPVYITIGNIHSDIRRQASSRATVLLGYLPVSVMIRGDVPIRRYRSLPRSTPPLSVMLAPLVQAGSAGVDVLCNDGNVRKAFMVLMSYIAEYPEQCL